MGGATSSIGGRKKDKYGRTYLMPHVRVKDRFTPMIQSTFSNQYDPSVDKVDYCCFILHFQP